MIKIVLLCQLWSQKERDRFLSATGVSLLLAHAVAFLLGKDSTKGRLAFGRLFDMHAHKPSALLDIGISVKMI
jgi:hypothetical protein